MSDYGHYSGLQFVLGGTVFFISFYELFPAIQQIGLQALFSLPVVPLVCFVLVGSVAGLARFLGLGFGMSMLVSTLVAVFALMIYFPATPWEVGLMMLSSFGLVIATPSRQ